MKILHLGFEDPRKPDAGGCAKRSHSINRRLASRHDITVLTSVYPGARAGVLEGVRYVPVGFGRGRAAALSYWMAVVPHVRRTAADIVVEEFNPPFGPGFAPVYSPAPVVGSVGWLFADAMQRKYHLPFTVVEKRGLRLYHDLITVTHDMATRLEAELPHARCWPVPNGLDESDFAPRGIVGEDIAFLGRLDVCQKGIDLALEAVAAIPDAPGRLLIAGEGRDRGSVEAKIRSLGLRSRVKLLGALHGADKRELLRCARVVLMPSRYETFGMVALEAFAVGCPVVGFDIPGLREVATCRAARLVPSGNVEALSAALGHWWRDADAAASAGAHGPAHAQRFRWDELAGAQEAVYLQVVTQQARMVA